MVNSDDNKIKDIILRKVLFQGGNMSTILRVCNGEGCNHEVIGCITNDWKNEEKWDCVICERKRPNYYETCAWSPWGGRKKKTILPEGVIEDSCYYCKNFPEKIFQPA